MVDQDTQELSMDEILASIRHILNDSVDRKPEESSSSRNPDYKQPDTPFVPVQNDIFATNKGLSDPTEKEIADICNNIRHLMGKSHVNAQEVVKKTNSENIISSPTIPLSSTKIDKDVSSQILDDFAAIFAKRRQQYPQTDSSVRNIAEAAVVNEVVPILQQWLQEKLPQAVQKEIERVMVKAGIR